MNDKETSHKIRDMLLKKYQELGAITFHEITVLVLFVILISLWMFRDPKFMPGWGSLFSKYNSMWFFFMTVYADSR